MVRTMKKLSCDIETFSDVDLIRCGVYKYADSPDFEMLLFAYAADDGDVHIIDIAGGEELPEKIIQAIKSDTVVKTAYNAQFERVCLSRYLKLPEGEYLNPQSWYCTAVQAAELALPLSLADVGSVLGLERQKMVRTAAQLPLPPASPLRGLPNALLTPHIAWATNEALQRLMDITANNLRTWLDGAGENIVNA